MTSDMQNSSPSDAGDGAGKPAGGSGLPVRGLAMILIAVAVLLAAWALWSMLSDSDDSAAGDTGTTETTVASEATPDQQNTAPVTAPDGEQDQNGQDTTVDENNREETVAGEGVDEPADERGADPAPARPAGSAADSTPVTTLHVLNNSTVTQLAARVADSLEGDYDTVESGNLPDVAIPRTTVYFTEGNPDAEKAARELADRVNGVAMERSPVLPEETEGEDAIVLVLVEDVTL
ncbi:hypothetical protein CFAEC_11905 [Corynebacterium faecale]|uniref:LytR C-terminal domain-containing protein n=1 Tax=Corynebacterium faecale TaxID=1758466 RepID=UPI0025B55E1A|nr:LytR C-terminal domain-containing protein [Corynebacterium faecale]WJY93173.1 hypothetical protein CFAEC_11905 [Corynebacterium faecale]